MSDQIKHECGIALIRLLKPLDYYTEKYGTPFYGLNKLYLLMQKQHNRGQDGAGIATIKLDPKHGQKYINRLRSIHPQPIKDIFENIFEKLQEKQPSNLVKARQKQLKPAWLKRNLKYTGELLLGHLRYGTHGKNSIGVCHPIIRQNNWMTRNLVLAGNFNLTNNNELFEQLIRLGMHPKQNNDTVTVLEKIGHFLDVENQRIYDQYKEYHDNQTISELIGTELNMQKILSRSSRGFDGGYVMAGLIGHGDAFVMRDAAGIRPAYWYGDDEVVVAASERPAIQTAFNLEYSQIQEIEPGHALTIKKNGHIDMVYCREPQEKKACSFERIYFSRGSDKEIYEERKMLGKLLAQKVLEAIDYDLGNTIFSYIPNTAETAFYGLIEGLDKFLNEHKAKQLEELGSNPDPIQIKKILAQKVRTEKLAVKDAKLRTFITNDSSRNDLVSHVYDVTYGQVNNYVDTLVMIDDSIVRGTTLKESILRILDRLHPKRIIIVSSAPQIRYPDCYGIDMSKMGDFVAFRAAIELLKDRGMENLMDDVYAECKAMVNLPSSKQVNLVTKIYEPFSQAEISDKIAEIITTEGLNASIDVIYQNIESLHRACPGHLGDWYFTGEFPTPGGIKVVNRAFINFMEGKNIRAYA